MKKDMTVARYFGDYTTMISDELKSGSMIKGYFSVTVFQSEDGQIYHISNANYDQSFEMELLGRVNLEEHCVKERLNKEIQVLNQDDASKVIQSIFNNTDNKKH